MRIEFSEFIAINLPLSLDWNVAYLAVQNWGYLQSKLLEMVILEMKAEHSSMERVCEAEQGIGPGELQLVADIFPSHPLIATFYLHSISCLQIFLSQSALLLVLT